MRKEGIGKVKMRESPVFYLKVNLDFAFSFRCIQKWVYIAESLGSRIIFICDNEKLKENILKKIIFVGKPDFIHSLVSDTRPEIDELCKSAFSPDKKWQNAAKAHLTCFVHARENEIKNFWNIDADDTEILLETPYCKEAFLKAQDYAEKNSIDAFSFDMHSTRVGGFAWSWGITYCQSIIDWKSHFMQAKNNEWHNHSCMKNRSVFNIDEYMYYSQQTNVARILSFYIDKCFFAHYGMIPPDLNHFMISLYHFKKGRLYFPFCTIAEEKENIFVPIKKSTCIKIIAGNTDKQSKIEFLHRFLIIDGMIQGFRNFGLDKTAYEWERKLFGKSRIKQAIKNIIKKTPLYKRYKSEKLGVQKI